MNYIEILGEIRSGYNVFDERDRQYYEALTKAISILKEHGAEMDNKVSNENAFDLFDRITTAWNGKQRFFLQEDGTVYDRSECNYLMSFDDAVNRFCTELSSDDCVYVEHAEWINDPNDYDDETWECSNCLCAWTLVDGTPLENDMHYCPTCGAKMTERKLEDVH